ncbi:putative TBP interacting domain protein [Aspergillus ruber CBS 135680]|uniref:TBPIP-domain-containing protein n=1 Tax=Aspergillus ruber (strain CBS 135680) TaxID=1388766 RepID=A0A017SH38_ASPRC|nr:TBPIP-domain-containing protein [Aspergillus ruber CBS 135680]EYE96298.1 TBPIP-domain-containing protein [Aspergillus ruber CBS 135680]
MSQKKGKADKKPCNDDGAALILDYLRKQNRPYSAIDISSNLHNKVTKAYAAKALRELHQNKEVEGRVAGKQTVYHALQDSSDEATTGVIANLDEEIKQLEENLTTLKNNEKNARAELVTIRSKPLLSELRQDIDRLEKEKDSMLARLDEFHGRDSSVQVSPKEQAEVEREWKRWQKQVIVRRRICRDMWMKCSEVVSEGMTREELWESLGLEGDCKW